MTCPTCKSDNPRARWDVADKSRNFACFPCTDPWHASTWKGESAQELVAQNICPKCMGELDTGWECNKCGFDALNAGLVLRESGKR